MAMYQVNKSRNITDTSPLEVSEIIEATGMAIFVISSLFLNISVCSVILKSKLLRRRTTNIFIINLGISNILITLLIMPFSCRAVILRSWDYGGIFCTINGMMSMTLFVASITTLCCISVDRYYAVVKPVKYKNVFTVRKAGFMVASCWFMSVSCASLPVFGWTKYIYHPGSNHCSPQWHNHCGYYFFMTCIGFGIPLVILFLTYWMIFAAIRKHERRFSTWNVVAPRSPCRNNIDKPVITVDAVERDSVSMHEGMLELNSRNLLRGTFRGRSRSICSPDATPNLQRKNKLGEDLLKVPRHSEIKRQSSLLQFRALTQIKTRLKSRTLTIPREYRIAKTGLGLFLVFFISWGPHMIVNNCSSDYITPLWVYRVSIWFVYTSCILNPVVYAFSSKHIRDAFRVALKCRRERRIADAFHMRRMSEGTSTNHIT